ncbi:MAG TPA: sterol desaturase family protein [Cellvibrio sp.]|nr:sterol desaturase family protein [Cellvibrio sp.]
MREFIINSSAIEIMSTGLVFFLLVYFALGTVSWFLASRLFPRLGIGRKLDHRPLAKGQLKREILLSLASIFIFGAGLIFPWGLLKLGWAQLAVDPSLLQILLEILLLVFWNEIHFYINHRLLHTTLLRRFHAHHHRSIVTTQWTAYSFHPVETMMLGSVLLLPMLVHDFSVYALVFVPMFSLLINSMGHVNYDFYPRSQLALFSGVRRHQLHHASYNGNYGFLFPFMDLICGTALPRDAVDRQVQS